MLYGDASCQVISWQRREFSRRSRIATRSLSQTSSKVKGTTIRWQLFRDSPPLSFCLPLPEQNSVCTQAVADVDRCSSLLASASPAGSFPRRALGGERYGVHAAVSFPVQER